ncbi:MAG TPA: hypothetical protein VM759_06725, partial [Longimicrobium sp.]|nr:hypothetical protein [Longimicrobium sp.]
PTERVIADPNPDWIGGINMSFQLFRNWRVTGLADVRHGGQVYNGTRSALYRFGTHKDTEYWRERTGQFGADFLKKEYPVVAGPGVGVVAFNNANDWQGWFTGNGGQNGPQAQFVEDGSFVKLREVSVSYTMDQPWVRTRLGLSTVDIRLAGRNLVTWTDYTGLDPEANLGGAEYLTQGIDFFNNPQTRSFVFSFTLNR